MLNGLRNLGNTCYFNVIIQSLSNIDLFVSYMKEGFDNDLLKECKEYRFAVNLKNMLIAMNYVDRKIINPHRLFDEFNSISDMMDIVEIRNQQDSEEILLQMFNLLHESIKYNVTISYNGVPKNTRDRLMVESLKHWDSYCGNSYSKIIELFYGQFLSQTTCKDCHYTNNNFDPFLPINIQINESCNTLKDAFKLFTKCEDLDGYKCDKCNKEGSTIKQLVLWKSPKILIIVLKRFIGDIKFQQHIDFPIEMNIGDYVKGYDTDDSNYILNSVVEHDGCTEFGHYICYCRKLDGYYKFSDELVEKVNNLKRVQAYILIYTKVGC